MTPHKAILLVSWTTADHRCPSGSAPVAHKSITKAKCHTKFAIVSGPILTELLETADKATEDPGIPLALGGDVAAGVVAAFRLLETMIISAPARFRCDHRFIVIRE